MSPINPNPHKEGYVYQPVNAVTAFFPPKTDALAVQKALEDAGFAADEFRIYQGEKGADKLDLDGDRHGAWVQFQRNLERLYADEVKIFDRIQALLTSGGLVAVVFTGVDQARADGAVETLKALGGTETRFWGEWVIERL
jgi:hypothetical protein